MNATVARIVDLLFENVAESEEVTALHDELMNNCQERFADLVARGVGEDEAVGEVVESLKGMEDVLAAYPVKADPFVKAAQTDPFAKASNSAPAADGEYTRIDVSVRGWDVMFEPAKDGCFHADVKGGDCQNINITFEGATACVREQRLTEAFAKAQKGENLRIDLKDMHWDNFRDMFHDLGQMLRRGIDSVGAAAGKVIVYVPASVTQIKAHTTSGDITLRGLNLTSAELCTTSGDVIVESGAFAKDLTATSTSGDVTIEGMAAQAMLNTMSGDIELEGSFADVHVNTISGDVDLTAGTTAVDSLNAKTVSGDLDLDLTAAASVGKVEIKSTSGDAELTLPEASDSVHASMTTVSGDIENPFDDAGEGAATQISMTSVSGDLSIN